MARKTKRRSVSKNKKQSRVRAWIGDHLGRGVCWVVMLSAVVVGVAAVMSAMEKRVLHQRVAGGAVRYRLELVNTPTWFPPSLTQNILAEITPHKMSFEDEKLCREVYHMASKNPWIASVQEVQRVWLKGRSGVVRVRGVYRKAVARVNYQNRTYFVDAEGVVLPYGQVPRWVVRDGVNLRCYMTRDSVPRSLKPIRKNYTLIEGVQTVPSVAGQVWDADDLTAGLQLIKLLSTRKYADQITVVDVRNHARRISETEPELRMYAQQHRGQATDIRFGRFPHPDGGDWVISPERKMKYLDEYVSDQGGRLAGVHRYIDVRYDELRFSLN